MTINLADDLQRRHIAAAPGAANRIIALDIARFLALIGMFSEHLLVGKGEDWFLAVVTGFPSTLFAVLGGISAVVSTRRYLAENRPGAACIAVATRGALLTAIGLILGFVPTVIAMVLAYFGVTLIVIAMMLWMRTWVLLSIAAVLAVVGPQMILWVRQTGSQYDIPTPSLDSPAAFAQSLFFTGYYPVITWVVYLLIGVCVGRVIITRRPVAAGALLALVGGAVAVVGIVSDVLSKSAVVHALVAGGASDSGAEKAVAGPGFGTPIGGGWIALVNAAPHTGTTADILRTSGVALVVIAVLLVISAHFPSRLPLLLRVIVRAGSAPLTIYVGHFLGFSLLIFTGFMVAQEGSMPWWAIGPWAILVHTAAAVCIGLYLALTNRRGPLEAWVSRRVRNITDRLTAPRSEK
ncbi:heparan-alpha-glucosaminide N-acetyltransferase domain-containing protein [Rathayibacter toxicus]|uniref:heparan-alpha-glucosaminide N-acetyltransferase domain-containing protein n=1 Tax=Rathayibacter toxicus TaxID=145458 RepID=UPI001C043C2A|nr:heparan-alpha-glucosaminide N-acetyltransferase domain-containing protein [Rathayibacter toxicus]QWL31130.1 DUF1624 domain-containing protein [Rathayibacter toxicus]